MSDVSVRMTLKDEVSSKLDKIKSSATTTARQFSNAGKAMDEAFRSSAASDFASQAESAFSSATSEAEALGNAINEVNSAYDDLGSSAGAYQDVNGRWHDANGKFIKSLGTTGEKIKDIDETLSGLGDDTGGLEGLSSQVGYAGTSMEQASAHAINFGSALKTLFAVAGGAVALSKVKEFAMDSISLGKEYTSMISEVAAISGASVSDMEMMETVAREYGASTIFSSSEAAEALKYMSLAGWDAQQSTSALGGVLNLAAASGMGLGEASDIVTGNLSAFGMEANQSTYLADMLAHAQSNSLTTAAELGEAYKNAAANMHASGQDVETTTALLEAMANQNRRGSEAGTSLAAVMRDITSKMDEGAIKIGETSIAVEDANGNFRDMTDIMTEVEAATEGMGSAQRVAALSSVFTDDSIKAVNMVLAEGMDKVAGYEEALRSAAGASEEMADIMNDNLKGDMANMSSAYEEMQLQVFEAMEEPLRDGAQWVTEDIIPTLTEWVPDAFGSLAGGISKVGEALSPMINTVLKNPQAVGATFASIGTGFAAMKTVNTGIEIAKNVSELGGMTKALSHFGTKLFGSPWAAGAAAAVSAITAVGLAVEDYNEMLVNENLKEHFGDISLSSSDIEGLAGKVIPVGVTADLNVSNVAFEEADELISSAEALLEENDTVTWRVLNVEGTLPDGDASILLTNTEDFVSSVTTALEKEEYAATLAVKTVLGENTTSDRIVGQMREWFAEDSEAMESIGTAVTSMLQNAINEGTYNVNTAAAISILEGKMLDLANGAREAELQGQLKFLEATSEDAALDAASWEAFVSQVGEYQTQLTETEKESSSRLFGKLEQIAYNDESRRETVDAIEEIITTSFDDLNVSSAISGASTILSSLNKAYDDELSISNENFEISTASWAGRLEEGLSQLSNGIGWDKVFDGLGTTEGFVSGGLDSIQQDALSDRFTHMIPTVETLKSSIDSYFDENGEQISDVPRTLMDNYYQLMEVGAAGGNEGAVSALVARQIATTFGDKGSFENALSQAGITSDYLSSFFGGTLVEEIDRAFAETTDKVDYSKLIDGISKSLSGEEPDWSNVESLLNEYGYSVSNALQEQGLDVSGKIPLNAENASINIDDLSKNLEGLEATGDVVTINGTAAVEYEVTAGQTMSEIASECGLALEELISANPQIENPNVINVGQKINIPASACSVDASGVSAATEEAVRSQTGEPIEREQPVTNVLTDAGTDASQVVSTTQSEVDNAFSSSLPADGTVDVSLEKGNDNVAALYSSVGDIVKNAWSQPYSASGSVNVVLTANYSLANPSATINFGGGATGSAAVTAALHAEGGIFDTPHYGVFAEAGPEAFIPIDGSDNAKAIWQETGIRLGLLQDEAPISIAPTHSIGTSRSNESVTGSGSDSKLSSKEINLNINGSGNMRIDGGVQKEDVLNMMVENIKDVLLEIIEQEILEEGDGAYEY